MLEKIAVKNFLVGNAPFFIILFGAALVTFSISPYQNYDAQLEFEAASNVLKQGLPYVKDFGLINQPPMGFYTEALFFKIFGSSISMGAALVAFFGLGSTVLVYIVGKHLYGKSTRAFCSGAFRVESIGDYFVPKLPYRRTMPLF